MESFEETARIKAPVELCYQCWRQFACLPSFMHNVKAVRQLEEDVWRWELAGPEGDPNDWDLLLAEDIPNQQISWRTLRGPEIDMWVDVHFSRIHDNLTQIRLVVTLFPPENPIGNVLKDLYAVTQRTISLNLKEFESVVEEIMEGTMALSDRGRPANKLEQATSWATGSESYLKQ